MNSWGKNIRVFVWDFDGTFYPLNPELAHAIREAEYRTIMEANRWTHERTEKEFNILYKTTFQSATQTVAHLAHTTTMQAAVTIDNFFDRRDYVLRDDRLIELFHKLGSFRHVILTNGVKKKIEETLAVLGVPRETFEDIVTSELVGENKPSEKGFRYILDQTKLPPGAHLMIGDREAVDLLPAKALGMHTCLVWADATKKAGIDVVLPTVYDLPTVL